MEDINGGKITEIEDNCYANLESELKKFDDEKDALILKNKTTILAVKTELREQMEANLQHQEDLEEREIRLELEKKRLQDNKIKAFCNKETIRRSNEVVEKFELSYQKLIEKHKKENRELKNRLYQESKKLAEKQKMELEMHDIESCIYTGAQFEINTEDSDRSEQGEEEKLKEMLKEKNEELESLEQMNLKLISMQREVNSELHKAREVAVQFLVEDSHSNICVKRMGELCEKPWKEACKTKFSTGDWHLQYVQLFSLWQDHVRDPAWFPFRVESCGDKHLRIVDWKDEKLNELKETLGEKVCNSVVQALEELNEYNSSGRYPIPELRNMKKTGRRVFLKSLKRLLVKSNKILIKEGGLEQGQIKECLDESVELILLVILALIYCQF